MNLNEFGAQDLMAVSTFIVVLFSAIVAYRAFLSQKRISIAKNTLDFMNCVMALDRTVFHIERTIYVAQNFNSDDLREMAQPSFNDEDGFLKSIRLVLNCLEGMANGIRHGVYDDNLLYSSYGSFVMLTYSNFHPYIEAVKCRNESYYSSLALINARWMAKVSK